MSSDFSRNTQNNGQKNYKQFNQKLNIKQGQVPTSLENVMNSMYPQSKVDNKQLVGDSHMQQYTQDYASTRCDSDESFESEVLQNGQNNQIANFDQNLFESTQTQDFCLSNDKQVYNRQNNNYTNVQYNTNTYKEESYQNGKYHSHHCDHTRPKPQKFLNQQEPKQHRKSYEQKIKTEICKNWQMTGHCELGDKCSFAHGYEELRNKNHLPSNFKTKICNNFHKHGHCQYGERCQFLHSTYDLENYGLSWKQALKEDAKLTLQKIRQQGVEGLPTFVNLKTGRGGGAPMKRLPIFEMMYNKEDYQKAQSQQLRKGGKAKKY